MMISVPCKIYFIVTINNKTRFEEAIKAVITIVEVKLTNLIRLMSSV